MYSTIYDMLHFTVADTIDYIRWMVTIAEVTSMGVSSLPATACTTLYKNVTRCQSDLQNWRKIVSLMNNMKWDLLPDELLLQLIISVIRLL